MRFKPTSRNRASVAVMMKVAVAAAFVAMVAGKAVRGSSFADWMLVVLTATAAVSSVVFGDRLTRWLSRDERFAKTFFIILLTEIKASSTYPDHSSETHVQIIEIQDRMQPKVLARE